MSDTLIVCLTCLTALVLLLGAAFAWSRQRAAETQTVSALTSRLTAALTRFENELSSLHQSFAVMRDRNQDLSEAVDAALCQQTPEKLLAFSERMVIFEKALQAAVAQIVNVSGYSEEKYKQLVADSVRKNVGPRPRG